MVSGGREWREQRELKGEVGELQLPAACREVGAIAVLVSAVSWTGQLDSVTKGTRDPLWRNGRRLWWIAGCKTERLQPSSRSRKRMEAAKRPDLAHERDRGSETPGESALAFVARDRRMEGVKLGARE